MKKVDVKQKGDFAFRCTTAKDLCKCIESVSKSVEPTFTNGNLQLRLFQNEKGTASFEILENGEAFVYDDVNDGDVDNALSRRRRLLSRGGNGKC